MRTAKGKSVDPRPDSVSIKIDFLDIAVCCQLFYSLPVPHRPRVCVSTLSRSYPVVVWNSCMILDSDAPSSQRRETARSPNGRRSPSRGHELNAQGRKLRRVREVGGGSYSERSRGECEEADQSRVYRSQPPEHHPSMHQSPMMQPKYSRGQNVLLSSTMRLRLSRMHPLGSTSSILYRSTHLPVGGRSCVRGHNDVCAETYMSSFRRAS